MEDFALATEAYEIRRRNRIAQFREAFYKKYVEGDTSVDERAILEERCDDLNNLVTTYMSVKEAAGQSVDREEDLGDPLTVDSGTDDEPDSEVGVQQPAPHKLPLLNPHRSSLSKTPSENPIRRRAAFLQTYGRVSEGKLSSDESREHASSDEESPLPAIPKSIDGRGIKGKKVPRFDSNENVRDSPTVDDVDGTQGENKGPSRSDVPTRKGAKLRGKASTPVSTASEMRRMRPVIVTPPKRYHSAEMLPPTTTPKSAARSLTARSRELRNLGGSSVNWLVSSAPIMKKTQLRRSAPNGNKSVAAIPRTNQSLPSEPTVSSDSEISITQHGSDTSPASSTYSLKAEGSSRPRARRRKAMIPASLKKKRTKEVEKQKTGGKDSAEKYTKQKVTASSIEGGERIQIDTETLEMEGNKRKGTKAVKVAEMRKTSNGEERKILEQLDEIEQTGNQETRRSKMKSAKVSTNGNSYKAQYEIHATEETENPQEGTKRPIRQSATKKLDIEKVGGKTRIHHLTGSTKATFVPDSSFGEITGRRYPTNNVTPSLPNWIEETPDSSLRTGQASEAPPTISQTSLPLEETAEPMKASTSVFHGGPAKTGKSSDGPKRRKRSWAQAHLDLDRIIPDVPSNDNSNLSSDRRVTRGLRTASQDLMAAVRPTVEVKVMRKGSKIIKETVRTTQTENGKVVETRKVVARLSEALNRTAESDTTMDLDPVLDRSLIAQLTNEEPEMRTRSGRIISPRKNPCQSCADCSGVKTTSGAWNVSKALASRSHLDERSSSPVFEVRGRRKSAKKGSIHIQKQTSETAVSHDSDTGMVSVTHTKKRSVTVVPSEEGGSTRRVSRELQNLVMENSNFGDSVPSDPSKRRVTRSSSKPRQPATTVPRIRSETAPNRSPPQLVPLPPPNSRARILSTATDRSLKNQPPSRKGRVTPVDTPQPPTVAAPEVSFARPSDVPPSKKPRFQREHRSGVEPDVPPRSAEAVNLPQKMEQGITPLPPAQSPVQPPMDYGTVMQGLFSSFMNSMGWAFSGASNFIHAPTSVAPTLQTPTPTPVYTPFPSFFPNQAQTTLPMFQPPFQQMTGYPTSATGSYPNYPCFSPVPNLQPPPIPFVYPMFNPHQQAGYQPSVHESLNFQQLQTQNTENQVSVPSSREKTSPQREENVGRRRTTSQTRRLTPESAVVSPKKKLPPKQNKRPPRTQRDKEENVPETSHIRGEDVAKAGRTSLPPLSSAEASTSQKRSTDVAKRGRTSQSGSPSTKAPTNQKRKTKSLKEQSVARTSDNENVLQPSVTSRKSTSSKPKRSASLPKKTQVSKQKKGSRAQKQQENVTSSCDELESSQERSVNVAMTKQPAMRNSRKSPSNAEAKQRVADLIAHFKQPLTKQTATPHRESPEAVGSARKLSGKAMPRSTASDPRGKKTKKTTPVTRGTAVSSRVGNSAARSLSDLPRRVSGGSKMNQNQMTPTRRQGSLQTLNTSFDELSSTGSRKSGRKLINPSVPRNAPVLPNDDSSGKKRAAKKSGKADFSLSSGKTEDDSHCEQFSDQTRKTAAPQTKGQRQRAAKKSGKADVSPSSGKTEDYSRYEQFSDRIRKTAAPQTKGQRRRSFSEFPTPARRVLLADSDSEEEESGVKNPVLVSGAPREFEDQGSGDDLSFLDF